MLEHVFGHAASVVDEFQLGKAVPAGQVDLDDTLLVFHTVQGVGQQVEHDLLDFLGVDRSENSFGRLELDLLVLVLADMADHVDHAGHHVAEDRGLPLGWADTREIQELLSDLLAAEGLCLDHLQILPRERVRLAAVELILEQAAFQRLGAHCDRREGIVDFVGHAGR